MRSTGSPERATAERPACGFDEVHRLAIDELHRAVLSFRQAYLRREASETVLRLAREVSRALQALRSLERELQRFARRSGTA